MKTGNLKIKLSSRPRNLLVSGFDSLMNERRLKTLIEVVSGAEVEEVQMLMNGRALITMTKDVKGRRSQSHVNSFATNKLTRNKT